MTMNHIDNITNIIIGLIEEVHADDLHDHIRVELASLVQDSVYDSAIRADAQVIMVSCGQ